MLKANSKLKNNGGKGQDGIANIGGSILTIRESLILQIAKDQVADVLARNKGKKISEIGLMELNKGLEARCLNRLVSYRDVRTEIARMQNHEIYGFTLTR